MSIRSAIKLCRNRVSLSIAAPTPEEMLSNAREAEFGLTTLIEALDQKDQCIVILRKPEEDDTLPEDKVSSLPTELDGVSVDENPEDETKEEKREREATRGFFG